jgi:hypothetical protein
VTPNGASYEPRIGLYSSDTMNLLSGTKNGILGEDRYVHENQKLKVPNITCSSYVACCGILLTSSERLACVTRTSRDFSRKLVPHSELLVQR